MSDFNKGVGMGTGIIIALIAIPVVLLVICCGGCLVTGGLGELTYDRNATTSTP